MTPLSNVINQATPKKILLNSYNKNRLASTYLFYGPDGVGKWSMALALTSLLNCEKPAHNDAGEVTDACGSCTNCRQVMSMNFPELLPAVPITPHKNESQAIDLIVEYIARKKEEPYSIITSPRQMTIPIDTARGIKRKSAVKPPEGLNRVILFYQMEKMLPASADSLLKLIEEPPPRTTIILTAINPDSLLPTIQSRAQKIAFRRLSVEDIAKYLVRGYDMTEEKANFSARLAEGSIGRAIAMIEDREGTSLRQNSFLMFKALFERETTESLKEIVNLIDMSDRGAYEQVLSYWQNFIADIMTVKYGSDKSRVINTDHMEDLERLAPYFHGSDTLETASDEIKRAIRGIRRNVHILPSIASLAIGLRQHLSQYS